MAMSSLAERLYIFKNLNLHGGRIIHAIFVIDTKCLYLSCALAQASSPLQSPYSCCQRVSSSGVLVKVSDGGAPISGGGIMSFFPCHQYILACWAVCQYKYRSRSPPPVRALCKYRSAFGCNPCGSCDARLFPGQSTARRTSGSLQFWRRNEDNGVGAAPSSSSQLPKYACLSWMRLTNSSSESSIRRRMG